MTKIIYNNAISTSMWTTVKYFQSSLLTRTYSKPKTTKTEYDICEKTVLKLKTTAKHHILHDREANTMTNNSADIHKKTKPGHFATYLSSNLH